MHGVAPFPLYWPVTHPRTPLHKQRVARFQVDFVTARTGLLGELQRLGTRDVLLSSNVPIRRDGLPAVSDREPQDSGVAVYFNRGGRPYVIACDTFTKVRWNLRAIGATIEALRSIERNSTSSMLDQAFSGFAQLPAASVPQWRVVLGIPDGPTTREYVQNVYKSLAHANHPDVGGDPARMSAINVAYEDAMRELAL